MRAVVQRVSSATVDVSDRTVGKIGRGLLILLGITHEDSDADVEYLANKILKLRVFEDDEGKMNLNVSDINGDLLVVSQFTLYGDCRKGNRPSYDKAANTDVAKAHYSNFLKRISSSGLKIEQGEFGSLMDVSLVNSGPVTILLDSKKGF